MFSQPWPCWGQRLYSCDITTSRKSWQLLKCAFLFGLSVMILSQYIVAPIPALWKRQEISLFTELGHFSCYVCNSNIISFYWRCVKLPAKWSTEGRDAFTSGALLAKTSLNDFGCDHMSTCQKTHDGEKPNTFFSIAFNFIIPKQTNYTSSARRDSTSIHSQQPTHHTD